MTPALYGQQGIACVLLGPLGRRWAMVRFTDQRPAFRAILGDSRQVLARLVRVLPPAGRVAA